MAQKFYRKRRKESVKVVLSRGLNENNKFLKVFVSKRNFDKFQKIGILLSENERYSFVVFDTIKANELIRDIEKIINGNNTSQDINVKTDNRGRELRISCRKSNILIRIIASEFLYANVNKRDLAWLLNSLKEAKK